MRAGQAQHDDTARPVLRAAGETLVDSPANGKLATAAESGWDSRTATRAPAPPMRPRRPKQNLHGRRFFTGLEWAFLIFGLLALDTFIWVNTAASLDQAYGDWAFDQSLRGLKPSIPGFIADEIGWIFGENRPAPPAPQENAGNEQPSVPAPSTPVRPLQPGTVMGRLMIPRLNLSVMVREGATESTLRRAVGHIPGTGLPGQLGNVALAGHRDTFFRPLSKIKKNDTIEVETGRGTYQYLVTATQIVSPRDVEVIKATAGKTLTLVTCYPFYYIGSAPKRFIVHAVEVSEVAANRRPRPQRGS
ncbi:MAG TPA: class D sortase [Bryobacteraceae bacterium]|nr:class D sortase [Bryobacteraceae bacterium]